MSTKCQLKWQSHSSSQITMKMSARIVHQHFHHTCTQKYPPKGPPERRHHQNDPLKWSLVGLASHYTPAWRTPRHPSHLHGSLHLSPWIREWIFFLRECLQLLLCREFHCFVVLSSAIALRCGKKFDKTSRIWTNMVINFTQEPMKFLMTSLKSNGMLYIKIFWKIWNFSMHPEGCLSLMVLEIELISFPWYWGHMIRDFTHPHS